MKKDVFKALKSPSVAVKTFDGFLYALNIWSYKNQSHMWFVMRFCDHHHAKHTEENHQVYGRLNLNHKLSNVLISIEMSPHRTRNTDEKKCPIFNFCFPTARYRCDTIKLGFSYRSPLFSRRFFFQTHPLMHKLIVLFSPRHSNDQERASLHCRRRGRAALRGSHRKMLELSPRKTFN